MTGTRPLLFDAYPSLARTVPWTPLALARPTAVEPCDGIAEWLGRGGVFMKRDDRIAPLYGGNKVRRFELVLADAIARGARRLVTVGGIASTQVAAMARFGPALGLSVHAILFDQPVTHFARQTIRDYLASGATLSFGGGYGGTAARATFALARARDAYFIAPGASGPRANLGYVDAMLELAGQVERHEAPRPDVIVVPAGSAGTLAALALGAAHLGWRTEVVGVRITSAIACNRATVGALVRRTDRFLGKHAPRWKGERARAAFRLYGGALGAGYGHPTPEAVEAIPRIEALIGVPGEVTYTGKALAALRTLGARPEWAGKTILFWNTLSSVPDDDARRSRKATLTPNDIPPELRFVFDTKPLA